MKQVGRNVYLEEQKSKYDTKLNLLRTFKLMYYDFRIMLIERRIKKYGTFVDYRMELCNAAIYEKQSYLYKIDSLYSKQELRDFERRVKRGNNKQR